VTNRVKCWSTTLMGPRESRPSGSDGTATARTRPVARRYLAAGQPERVRPQEHGVGIGSSARVHEDRGLKVGGLQGRRLGNGHRAARRSNTAEQPRHAEPSKRRHSMSSSGTTNPSPAGSNPTELLHQLVLGRLMCPSAGLAFDIPSASRFAARWLRPRVLFTSEQGDPTKAKAAPCIVRPFLVIPPVGPAGPPDRGAIC
jgi:hypothetical protein